MYVLGISCYYHDASAALLKNGEIVAAAQEERFTRKKHDFSFPINAIEYCLDSRNITINEIDHIGFYEKPLLKFERVLFQHLELFPLSLKTFVSSMPSWINDKLRILKTIKKKLKYKKDVFFIEHHLAHASSFLLSPFDKAAILSIDGVGEWTTTVYGIGDGNNIKLKKKIEFPSSLGLLYSTITAFLGFKVNNSEYKVMGLAAYGNNTKSNKFYHKLRKIIDIKDDGSYRLNMDYFVYHYKDTMYSKKLVKLLGCERKFGESIKQKHKDLAAALQMIYEETLFKIFNHVYSKTKCKNLVLSGGCSLNSVANGKVLKNTPFKNVWIQPDPGDGGTSVGVAAYVYHSILGKKRTSCFSNPYLGPGFDNDDIKTLLEKNNVKYQEFRTDQELIKTTAEIIYKNKIIAWFQDRMEYGPRALGNRSILANPCNQKMRDILNEKVKHRESFRPFAPVVCYEDASKYFETDKPVPEPTDYMLMVYPIKKKYHTKLPSVTHVDGTGRLQTIKREQNPLYYDLINEFYKITNVPVLINTSMNVMGEPIVNTPEHAYNMILKTDMDCIVLGNNIIFANEVRN